MQKMHDMTEQRLPVEFDERKIGAIFAEVNQCHLPGAAVGIAIDGKPYIARVSAWPTWSCRSCSCP